MSIERFASESRLAPGLASVLQLLLIILLFCCTVYAGSTSIGSLGNFPLAESRQPLSIADGSVFIHGSFMVWRCQSLERQA